MSEQMITALVTVLTAIIGVAVLAVIVSKNANTTSVISSAGQAFASDLGAATAPVTGSSSISMPSIGQIYNT